MIGNPKWFKRRKYGGWGLFPITWQGWVYTIVLVGITFLLVSLPVENSLKIGIVAIWAIFMLFEIGTIMLKIKDEREKIHEAIAERNALWAIILVIVVAIGYQTASGVVKNDFSQVDPFLIAAVVIGLVVKAISNFWLERKN